MEPGLEGLAAGCLLPDFEGTEAPGWLRDWLERGLGGVGLFARNIVSTEQVATLCADLRAINPAVVVTIDEEGGDVSRLEVREGSSYPGNAALGRVDDETLTEAVAASMAADLRRVGVNLNFAPCADVIGSPGSPAIGVRSFGSDPELVARHTRAYVRGMQKQGIAACAKHFPGHG